MAENIAGPGRLVNELAAIMKTEGIVTPPQWSAFVKTGAHAQRPPHNPDWWYVRAASVLWQVYRRGPIGVGKLRGWYGGRKKRGTQPEIHAIAGGKVIRTCLQQLEKAGLLVKEGTGRKVTSKGQSMVDKLTSSIRPRTEKKAMAKAPEAPKAPAEKPKKAPKAKKPKAPAEPTQEAPAEKPKKPAKAKKAVTEEA